MDEAARESKYTHLLKPIRDLADNWSIDIASELEEYLHELENVSYAFDGMTKSLNFAEAALVIQGSTCIYSKKVEYLYSLLYQTIDHLTAKRKDGRKKQTSLRKDGTDVDAKEFYESEPEFLTLDDIKEAANIDLLEDEDDPYGLPKRSVVNLGPAPLALMPLGVEAGDGSKQSDFRMNTGVVHTSGALLIDNKVLDNSAVYGETRASAGSRRTSALQVPNIEIRGAGVSDDEASEDEGEPMKQLPKGDGTDCVKVQEVTVLPQSEKQRSIGFGATQQSEEDDDGVEEDMTDYWEMMDPHSTIEEGFGSRSQPFRKGKTFRVPKLLGNIASKGQKEQEQSEAKATKERAANAVQTFLEADVGLTGALIPELKSLYLVEVKRRAAIRLKANKKLSHRGNRRKRTVAAQPGNHSGAIVPDGTDAAFFGDGTAEQAHLGFGTHNIEALDLSIDHIEEADDHIEAWENYDPVALDDPAEVHLGDPTNGSVAFPDDPFGGHTYEDWCKKYIDEFIASAARYAVETDLSRRVSEWQDRIEPLLAEEELRPIFDIHSYAETMIKKFPEEAAQQAMALQADQKTKHNKGRAKKLKRPELPEYSFGDLVKMGTNDMDTYEFCRFFVTTLQLANTHNVEIIKHTKESHVSVLEEDQEEWGKDSSYMATSTSFSLRLLNTKIEDLPDDYRSNPSGTEERQPAEGLLLLSEEDSVTEEEEAVEANERQAGRAPRHKKTHTRRSRGQRNPGKDQHEQEHQWASKKRTRNAAKSKTKSQSGRRVTFSMDKGDTPLFVDENVENRTAAKKTRSRKRNQPLKSALRASTSAEPVAVE